MMSYKAVLFDLDGTLLDTLADIGNAVNRVLLEHGFPIHDVEAYRYFVGDGVTSLITRALPENKRLPAIIDSCKIDFKEDYDRNWKIFTRIYRGIPEMLDELTHRGIKLAILSNKPQYFTELCVKEFLSKWRFEAVLGQRNSIPLKPDPQGALEIVHQMGISASDFLYLGDSNIDIRTALAAGMYPVGVLWGFRSKAELQAAGAKALIVEPMDIVNLFDL